MFPASIWWAAISVGVSAVTLAGQEISFRTHVRPILSDNCFQCHGPDAGHRKASLRLDTEAGSRRVRKGRAAIVPGDPDRSEVIARITAAARKDRMPPENSHKELTPEQIRILTEWVRQGARYEAHWSYQPLRRVPPPLAATGPGANRIDAWLRVRRQSNRVPAAPPADPVTLLRRVTLDLTGLPPTVAEIDRYLADRRPDRFARTVDRLLASPRYAERMASYWLDLVRYADTVGYHGDQDHRITPYRDYVIQAFHENLPFDQFTVEQLAGDLLPEPTERQRVATGYNRLLQTTHEGGAQAKEYLAIYAADRVRNLSEVWLGATLGCAQCHDHKYDPYLSKDFYAMAAFFADIQEVGDFKGSPNSVPTTRPPELLLLGDADRQAHTEAVRALKKATAALRRSSKDARLRAEVKALTRRVRAIEGRGRWTMITVATTPRPTRVLARGDWMDESGPLVSPAVPHFLPQIRTRGRRATRLDLARWLTSEEQPLTARVFVNRMWYLLFGRGLAADVTDFGSQGQAPDHPELLDALALDFIEGGWDIKGLLRQIVNSQAYRQSSIPRDLPAGVNPGNRLFAWQGRWRLPAEMIRDNALAVSGLLVHQIGGESVKPYQPAGYYQHLNFPRRRYQEHLDERQWRRGVYVHWQRQFLHPALKAFDAPAREECTTARAVSNTPQAALTLLNDPSFVEAARVFGGRMEGFPGDEAAKIAKGFREATSRPPTADELKLLRAILAEQRREFGADPAAAEKLIAVGRAPRKEGVDPVAHAAWTGLARVILNLHETTTRN